MQKRLIKPGIYWLGAIDWHRRLFDALIPLPDGTSYNAYLVQGSAKTALLDTVDPSMTATLLAQLADVPQIDFIIAHHAEQDHSGAIPEVLRKYPQARVLSSPRGKSTLADHLGIDPGVIDTVEDGATLDLGGKTLKFVHTPWVHWPETMCTFLQEDGILFSCDFFGSHFASSELCVCNEAFIYDAAKRYYAEIMMPFRAAIGKNLDKIAPLGVQTIAPSHGQIYDQPEFIIAAYRNWVSDACQNLVVIPFISMHESTARMVDYLTAALVHEGVMVQPFDLVATDLGNLAISLVDAATVVLGSPTVLAGPHPHVVAVAYLTNALRPKFKFASVIGSYGWGSKVPEQLLALMPNLKVTVLDTVLCKGIPTAPDFAALDRLALAIVEKHRELNLI